MPRVLYPKINAVQRYQDYHGSEIFKDTHLIFNQFPSFREFYNSGAIGNRGFEPGKRKFKIIKLFGQKTVSITTEMIKTLYYY